MEMKNNVYRDRVTALRKIMSDKKIDAYIIVSDDFHASEYVGEYFMCRAYVSGFDGSAGTLVITSKEACLWTDGRYFLQAGAQLEGTGIKLMKIGEEGVPSLPDYLKKCLLPGQCIGYDGRTISWGYAQRIKDELADMNIEYVESLDLVDEIWNDRPEFPANKVWILDDRYTGKSRAEKLSDLRKHMRDMGVKSHLLASLDDIAWLYNIRGNDIEYNPVAMAYSIIYEEKAVLYVSPEAVAGDVQRELSEDGVEIRPYLQVYSDLREMETGTKLMLDKDSVNVALISSVPEGVVVFEKTNPTTLSKAVKTPVEMENERKAHVQDGVAVTKLIYWLKKNYGTEPYNKGEITELSVCEKLLELRKEREGFIEESFAPIVASGAHGAIVHYEPTKDTDIPLGKDTFVLMDTGGQYFQGTTDITRTVALGKLSGEQKKHYTAVLRGHLNLGAAYFKYGCTGSNLDYLAREPLWEIGLDYNHGTGHGVGYLLNVHEGPNRITLKNHDGGIGTAFEEGMITSNEPGVYLEGEYGIRTENMILCKKALKNDMGQFMNFETLTLVPYDRDAILAELLSDREKEILNAYHSRVYEKISPFLEADERKWLKISTEPI